MYGVSFLKLVDSAWAPRLDFKRFDNFKLRGSKDHISVKTSAPESGVSAHYEPINIQKFSSKEEFIAFAVQEAIGVWDKYEASKQFGEETTKIIEDIEKGVAPTDVEFGVESPLEDEYIHDNMREYHKTELQSGALTEEEVVAKVLEIKKKNVGDSWKPYMLLKEIIGVDLINTPDIATDERVAEMQSKRPSAVDNEGAFRRADARIRKTGYTA